MKKSFLLSGFIFGLIAIILGAFGAHGLENILSEDKINSFQVGVRYQMYHAILLIALASIKELQSKLILNLIISGVILFSVSIYLLSINEYLAWNYLKVLGPITPIGGTILISAWGLLIFRLIKKL